MPATINLLPRKEFEITLTDGTIIKGQYGTWALKRFSDKQGYSLKQAGEKLSDPSMADVVEYVLCAVEHTTRKLGKEFTYNDIDACSWIDDLGGVQSDTFLKLFSHSADENIESDEQKKTVTEAELEPVT